MDRTPGAAPSRLRGPQLRQREHRRLSGVAARAHDPLGDAVRQWPKAGDDDRRREGVGLHTEQPPEVTTVLRAMGALLPHEAGKAAGDQRRQSPALVEAVGIADGPLGEDRQRLAVRRKGVEHSNGVLEDLVGPLDRSVDQARASRVRHPLQQARLLPDHAVFRQPGPQIPAASGLPVRRQPAVADRTHPLAHHGPQVLSGRGLNRSRNGFQPNGSRRPRASVQPEQVGQGLALRVGEAGNRDDGDGCSARQPTVDLLPQGREHVEQVGHGTIRGRTSARGPGPRREQGEH